MGSVPVAAVVVNLDGGAMLDACLDALLSNSPATTVVVDNGSKREELERLEARGVLLVRLSENEGFAGPANTGVEAALKEKELPYVAFVNNDCVLEADYLGLCVAALEARPDAAAAQGIVLDGGGSAVDGRGIAWSGRRGRARAVQLGKGEAPPPASDPVAEVPGVSATAAVYRTSAFRAAGGFEESFFAYYEDVDLALRLARTGARFLCVPAARARHEGSATGRREPDARWRRLFANRLRTLRRNVKPELVAGGFLPPGLKSAAAELGWTRALLAASGALAAARSERRRDREVFEALPPLSKLPH
jgi:GT2 family glycosyltransferase